MANVVAKYLDCGMLKNGIPGILIFRVESSLLYLNTEYVLKVVMDKVPFESTHLLCVICDLSTSSRRFGGSRNDHRFAGTAFVKMNRIASGRSTCLGA